jgi:hypothetical protein
MIPQEQIDNNFVYHAPKPGQNEKYETLRRTSKVLAELINESCPDSREKSLAINNLELSLFWANTSIARNE